MSIHEISRHYPNGSFMERYAIPDEANPDEEWDAAIEDCMDGETVTRYVNGVEVDRFYNDAAFARAL